jgi:hypothetical protein
MLVNWYEPIAFLCFYVFLHQSPTGHPNQIHKANERQTLHIESQFLQIIQK